MGTPGMGTPTGGDRIRGIGGPRWAGVDLGTPRWHQGDLGVWGSQEGFGDFGVVGVAHHELSPKAAGADPGDTSDGGTAGTGGGGGGLGRFGGLGVDLGESGGVVHAVLEDLGVDLGHAVDGVRPNDAQVSHVDALDPALLHQRHPPEPVQVTRELRVHPLGGGHGG